MLLCFADDGGHGRHGLHRVFARGAFAGKHDGTRAVVDGVGHVGNFRARGARVVNHGFEHLRRCDDALAKQAAGGDEALLDGGQLGKRDLDAEIAAGDHDALADLTDLIDVVDACAVFDLRDHVDLLAAVGRKEVLEVKHVLLAGDEGGRDEVDAVLDAEQQIGLILLAEIGLLEDLVRETHALPVGQFAADLDTAMDVLALDAEHLKDDEAVVDEDLVARVHFLREALVADADDALVALNVAGGEREGVAVVQRDLPVSERADAVFRAFRVEQDGDWEAQLFPDGADHVELCFLLLMRPVGKVQPRDVHACAAHVGEYGAVAAGRADGTYDLGFSHSCFAPLLSVRPPRASGQLTEPPQRVPDP